MFLANRKWALLALLVITPVGFYTKFYSGPASEWVNNSLGGVLYVMFWALLVYLLAPKIKPLKIASAVFIITCVLEVLQLWHPPFLQYLRSYFIGRTILGTSFVWSDFPHYLIGALLSWWLLRFILKREAELQENTGCT